jgi:hypothetical protein
MRFSVSSLIGSPVTDVDFIRPEPPRDRYGRYLIAPPDGGKAKAYTRATTIADTLDDRYNLELWKIRMTALGLVERPDYYASIASLPKDDKAKINQLCEKAIEAAKGSAGANLGTALHRFTERINRGEDVKVPAPWDADIEAYKRTLLAGDWWSLDRTLVERIVVHHELGVAGTFDLVLLEGETGNRYIADLKTGATLDFSWGAIAIQLAIYAHADTLYNPVTETHEPMPAVDQDTAIVIHLPAGQATCTLYNVDIAAGWEACQHALWARGWRKRKDLACPMPSASLSASSSEKPSSTPPNISSSDIDKLRLRYNRLTEAKRIWVLNLGGALVHDQRSYELGLALVRFAELDVDDDILRAAYTKTAGKKLSIRKRLADHLAEASIEQCQALSQIAIAIHNGEYAIRYTDDGVHLDAA